jgi:ferredoxin
VLGAGATSETVRNEAEHEDRRMRIAVDFDKCKSNALCMGVAPEIFEVRDDNFLYVLQDEPPESARALVEEAVRICPTQAISIVE